MGKVNKLLELLFPNFTCVACGCEIVDSDNKYLCKYCMDKLPFVGNPSKSHYCPFIYTEPIRSMILSLKYSNNGFVAKAIAPFMAAIYLKFIKKNREHILVPVPLCKERYRERGYNQSEILAKEIATYLDIEVETNVLIRVKKTVPQKVMTAEERYKNMKNAFSINANADKIAGKNILLIDDVFTTGATTKERAKVLRKFGAKSVTILTIAEADF